MFYSKILVLFYNNQKRMRINSNLVIALLMLFAFSACENWQGIGTMSESNMTAIWNYINTNFSLMPQPHTYYQTFADDFSTHLNQLWDPAWNVVVVYISEINENSDSVLYGYAFRDHWFWYNGLQVSSGNYLSFIIWKDYNCIYWESISTDVGMYSTFTIPESFKLQAEIQDYRILSNKDDIWGTGIGFVNYLTSKSYFSGSDKAFSVIVSQSPNAKYYARVCVSNYFLFNDRLGGQSGNYWGRVLILRMR